MAYVTSYVAQTLKTEGVSSVRRISLSDTNTHTWLHLITSTTFSNYYQNLLVCVGLVSGA